MLLRLLKFFLLIFLIKFVFKNPKNTDSFIFYYKVICFSKFKKLISLVNLSYFTTELKQFFGIIHVIFKLYRITSRSRWYEGGGAIEACEECQSVLEVDVVELLLIEPSKAWQELHDCLLETAIGDVCRAIARCGRCACGKGRRGRGELAFA